MRAAVLAAGLSGAVLAGSAAADVAIVYDASNSMWGQIEGRHKVEIAREVMAELITDWDAQTPVGLVAYGHRREGDCSDIEVVIEPGPLDAEAFIGTVNGLMPRGKTPLTDAVREAAELLRYEDRPARVLLLSDGIESCEADPCALAAELERAGVGFTAHVIGFDVAAAEDRAQLSCIAENTGGMFRTAANAGELREALTQVAAAATEPDPEPEPEPETPAATVEADDVVAVGAPFEVSWTGPANENDYITIAEPDQPDAKHLNYSYVREGSPLEVMAPAEPGLYELRYILREGRQALARAEIEVEDVEATLEAADAVPVGSPFEVTWTGPGNKNDYITIADPDQPDGKHVNYSYAREGSPLEVMAPGEPGLYELRYILREGRRALATRAIEVEAVEATLEAADAVPVGAPFEVTWTGPGNKNDYITIAEPDQPDGKHVNYSYAREGSPLAVTAPAEPGLYELRYILREGRRALARREIEVADVPVSLEAEDEVPVGSAVEVAWTGPGNDNDYIAIAGIGAPDDDHIDYAYAREGSPLEVQAPLEPGLYELRYILREGRRVMAREEIEVAAVEARFEAPESVAPGQRFEVAIDGPGLRRDRVVLVARAAGEEAGERAQSAHDAPTLTFTAPEEEGPYELRYLLGREGRIIGRQGLEVAAVGASIDGPATVAAGESFEVRWNGPAGDGDRITLAEFGSAPTKWRAAERVSEGNPLELKAPNEPGLYELRYYSGESRQIAATREIEVE